MAERITELLIRHNGQAFCDDCLRRTLKGIVTVTGVGGWDRDE
jgi:hypothetical protein